MVKQATTIAIPGKALKPWICRIADERTASPALDAAIASQENDVPRAKPISASRTITTLMQSPFRVFRSNHYVWWCPVTSKFKDPNHPFSRIKLSNENRLNDDQSPKIGE